MVGTGQHGDDRARRRPKGARADRTRHHRRPVAAFPSSVSTARRPHPPAIALDVLDNPPLDWPKPLADIYGDVWSDPASWARRAKELGADLVNLRLVGTHPDEGNRSAEQAVETVQGGARRGRSAADHLGLRRADQGHRW